MPHAGGASSILISRMLPDEVIAFADVTGDSFKLAREAAARIFALYGTLPSYRAMLDLEGVSGPAEIVIAGDERAIESAVRSLASAGVTDLSASTFPFGSEGAAVAKRTTALLAELAKAT